MERPAPVARLSMRLGASIAAVFICLLTSAAGASAALGEAARVADINPGPIGSSPESIVPYDRFIVFRSGVTGIGDELTVSDGTAAGTSVFDLRPGPLGSSANGFTPLGGRLVFAATDASGEEIWRTDATADGTARIADINPGPGHSSPRDLLGLGESVVFKANDGSVGTEPWRTDGTAAGTTLVADVDPGPPSGANDFNPERLGTHVLFEGTEPTVGSELWRLPVTGTGADLVANVRLAGGSDPRQLTAVGSTVLFIADDGIVGEELWRSDGQPGGDYALVEDFDNAATDSGVNNLSAFGDHVYFQADGDGNGAELWRADGTGAEIVFDVNPVGDSNPQSLTPIGDWLYFTAVGNGTGRELWRSDGIPGGTTQLVADINPAGGNSMCASPRFIPIGNLIFFCAFDGGTDVGRELWRTDGTPSGTDPVADINPGPGANSDPFALTAHGDTLYFGADDGASGAELWAVDTGRPDTAVDSGPAAGSLISDRTPSFQLSSTAVDLASFDCSPTGDDGSFVPCAARDGAATLAPLADGEHQLTFRAVDVRDNADRDPAVLPLTVDGTAPRIVVKGKRLKLSERGTVRLKAVCKRSERSGPCRGKVVLKTAKGKPKAKVAKKKFKLEPGKAKRLKLKVRPSKLALVEDGASLRAQGNARDRLGNKRKFRSKKLRVSGP